MFSLFPPKKQFLDKDAQQRVVDCIKAAEIKTSGEIRVFMEPSCIYVDPLERAKEIFANLKMEQTEERNAVIIYVAFKDRQFALFGDVAIYEKAGGAAFWQKAAGMLSAQMRNGAYTEGLCNCVNELGNALAAHFPPNPNINKNELPDEIVFGK
jgi:uncharacterized membrane protein